MEIRREDPPTKHGPMTGRFVAVEDGLEVGALHFDKLAEKWVLDLFEGTPKASVLRQLVSACSADARERGVLLLAAKRPIARLLEAPEHDGLRDGLLPGEETVERVRVPPELRDLCARAAERIGQLVLEPDLDKESPRRMVRSEHGEAFIRFDTAEITYNCTPGARVGWDEITTWFLSADRPRCRAIAEGAETTVEVRASRVEVSRDAVFRDVAALLDGWVSDELLSLREDGGSARARTTRALGVRLAGLFERLARVQGAEAQEEAAAELVASLRDQPEVDDVLATDADFYWRLKHSLWQGRS